MAGGFSASSSLSNRPPGMNAPDVKVTLASNTRKCILNTCALIVDLRMINRVVHSQMNRGQSVKGQLMVPKKRSTTCPILQRSGSELFSRRNNSYRFVHIYNSSIHLRKGHSEGPKCKTVSPQGASRVPGMDIMQISTKHQRNFIIAVKSIVLYIRALPILIRSKANLHLGRLRLSLYKSSDRHILHLR
jgi:hypothetical protein